MRTQLITLGLALIPWLCAAQDYTSTNMQVAATITNGSTYTYAGTNYVDAKRYSEVAFEHTASGPGVETNNYTWTFRLSLDGTNYGNAPVVTWVASGARSFTNISLGVYGYIQPYQRVSTNPVDHTNSALVGYLKGYRRD